MTKQEMPARIWAWWFTPDKIIQEMQGGWTADHDKRLIEYRRADLPPTPAEAMRCPEVAALVEAMRNAIEAIDAAYDGPDDNGRYSTRERAALAALKQGARRG